MSREIRGFLLSRLIILISILAVPIVIFLIFAFVDFSLWFSTDPVLNFWLIKVLCPTVFSVSWLFFLILFANRFSKTIESMDKTVGIIPLRLKIFYGINALFILFIFVFPLITPVIAVLSFASIAWHMTTYRKKSWDDSGVSFLTKFTMVLFSALPIFCTVCIITTYLDLPIFLWNNVWLPIRDYVFTFSYCLCTALAIGSLFILLANRGVSEYEQLFADPDKIKSMGHVKIFELVFFVILFVLALYKFEIVPFFYYAGFVIVVLVSIVNYFSGKSKTQKFSGHIFGYILAGIFMSSNFFLFNPEVSLFLSNWTWVALAAIFIIIFVITFIRFEEI